MVECLQSGQCKHQDDEQKHRHQYECSQVFVIKLQVHEDIQHHQYLERGNQQANTEVNEHTRLSHTCGKMNLRCTNRQCRKEHQGTKNFVVRRQHIAVTVIVIMRHGIS